MSICVSKTKSGKDCKNPAKMYDRCGVHAPKYMQENNLDPPEPEVTITVTFGDAAENHVGMAIEGQIAERGYSPDDIVYAFKTFTEMGAKCEIIHLNDLIPDIEAEQAELLIIRNGVKVILDTVEMSSDNLKNFLENIQVDTTAKMKGKVVNKHARHNVCFGDIPKTADIANGQGTVIAFEDSDELSMIRFFLNELLEPENVPLLQAELNKYYDISICGIGYHSDLERRKTIGCRFGTTMPLCFHWYQNSKRIGEKLTLSLNNNDMYIMSAKANGFDGRKRKIPILRHAAGCAKYTK